MEKNDNFVLLFKKVEENSKSPSTQRGSKINQNRMKKRLPRLAHVWPLTCMYMTCSYVLTFCILSQSQNTCNMTLNASEINAVITQSYYSDHHDIYPMQVKLPVNQK